MDEMNFKGVFIPASIWFDSNLNANELRLLMQIHYLDNGSGCTARNVYFAETFQLSESRVSEIIRALVDKKQIHIKQEKFKTKYEGIKQRRTIRITNPALLAMNNKPAAPSENRTETSEIRSKSSETRSKSSEKAKHKKEIENRNLKEKSKRERKPKFSPPALIDVQNYFLEIVKKNVDAFGVEQPNDSIATEQAEMFFDWYQSNGWKQKGGTPIKDWRAAARNWNRRQKDFKNSGGASELDRIINQGKNLTFTEAAKNW